MAIPQTGLNTYFNSTLTNTAVAVRTTGTLIFYVQAVNLTAIDAYLQIFDVAQASITVGTTVPTMSFLVPGASVVATNAGGITQQFSVPLETNTALSVAAATTATGGTAPGTALVVNIGYLAR